MAFRLLRCREEFHLFLGWRLRPEGSWCPHRGASGGSKAEARARGIFKEGKSDCLAAESGELFEGWRWISWNGLLDRE